MKEAIRRILPTAGIIVLLTALMAVVLLWMGRMEIISLPDFVMRIFDRRANTDETESPEDDGGIYQALEERVSNDWATIQPELTAEDALEMLRKADNPSKLYIENTVTLYADGVGRVIKNKINLDAEKYRVVADSGISVICDGEDISYSDSEGSYIYTSERSCLSDYASMPDIKVIIDILTSKTAAVELRRSNGENILYVQFEIASLNQTEKYYVSLDYGVVVRAESYYGERLVYSLTTQTIQTAEYEDSVFTISRQVQSRQSR